MKTIKFYYLFIIPLFFVQCTKENISDNSSVTKDREIISDFIHDGLSTYYLWYNELPEKVNYSKLPEDYFSSLLYKDDPWSWIVDDVDKLIGSFKGDSKSFGFDFKVFLAKKESEDVYAAIKYVYSNTPASQADLKRGDIIYKVDGEAININNYQSIFSKLRSAENTVSIDFARDIDGKLEKMTKSITPTEVSANPLVFHKIFEIDGKKIGYLFYASFIKEYNNDLFKVFSEFKSQGVNEFILDLRYNPGGSVSSAVYLSSLIAPESAVRSKEVFSSLNYNDKINKEISKEKRSRFFGEKGKDESDPLLANLNLSKVYIIATRSSYSASECVTFCLKPFLNVVHIGSPTGGKYTASWTIVPFSKDKGVVVYDSTKLSSKEKQVLAKWAMQPIVAKYVDKNGKSFENEENHNLKPNYNVEESPINYKELGSEEDPFVKKALFLITGDDKYKDKDTKSRSAERDIISIETKPSNTDMIIDDMNQETINSIMNIYNSKK